MVSCNLLALSPLGCANISAQQQGGDWGDFCCIGFVFVGVLVVCFGASSRLVESWFVCF